MLYLLFPYHLNPKIVIHSLTSLNHFPVKKKVGRRNFMYFSVFIFISFMFKKLLRKTTLQRTCKQKKTRNQNRTINALQGWTTAKVINCTSFRHLINPLNTAQDKNTYHQLIGECNYSSCYKLIRITKTYWKQNINPCIKLYYVSKSLKVGWAFFRLNSYNNGVS